MERGAGKPDLTSHSTFSKEGAPFSRPVGTGGDFWNQVDEDRYAALVESMNRYKQ